MRLNLTCVKPHQEVVAEVEFWLPQGAQNAEQLYDSSKNKTKNLYKNIAGYITINTM